MKRLMTRWLCRTAPLLLTLMAVGVFFVLSAGAQNGVPPDDEESKIQIGFEIAPVPLNTTGLNLSLVGLGSYIINASSTCNDCHTWPHYAPGGDPFQGQPEQVNTADYLGGGRNFGNGIVSRNLTPDPVSGMPANLTFAQFENVIRTGEDPDNPNSLLQVMPWPTFRNMNDRDLRAIYEYLSAIPTVP